MAIRLELFIHPMCPFAQRALYSMAFKQLTCTIREINLAARSSSIQEANPYGSLPALKISTELKEYILHESLVISEYFDSFPGPSLYPRLQSGEVNPIVKALINMLLSDTIEPMRKQIGVLYFSRNPTKEEIDRFKRTIGNVNSLLPNGKYFLYKLLGRDEISFADVMALPLIERILAFKDQGLSIFESLELKNLELWHHKIKELQFVKEFEISKHRIINLKHHMQNGTYHGLVLPVTYYDTIPKV